MSEIKKLEILGVPVDMVNMAQAAERLEELMKSEGCSLIVTPNSEIVVNAGQDSELMEIIRSADLVIPDGIGLVYASKLLGSPLKERVTGIDFLNWVLYFLEREGKSIYLLGSRPGSERAPGVAEMAAIKMKEAFPGLKIAVPTTGISVRKRSKKFDDINESGADFLCVALGSPKQEKFMAQHREGLKVKAAIGVGGSLDVWAGEVKRAPEFYRKHGLEWLYRLVQQPSRYKRMAALPRFMIRVLLSK